MFTTDLKFRIDQGIPIPPKGSSKAKKPSRYPMDIMLPGDSCFFPLSTTTRARISNTCFKVGKRVGGKFTYRSVQEGDELGFRVWRVS